MGVGTWAWELIQFFEHSALLCAQLVLCSLVLHVAYQGLICTGAWRVFDRVDRPFDCGVLGAVLAHVSLCAVVGTRTWSWWDIVLFLWSLFGANSIQMNETSLIMTICFDELRFAYLQLADLARTTIAALSP